MIHDTCSNGTSKQGTLDPKYTGGKQIVLCSGDPTPNKRKYSIKM